MWFGSVAPTAQSCTCGHRFDPDSGHFSQIHFHLMNMHSYTHSILKQCIESEIWKGYTFNAYDDAIVKGLTAELMLFPPQGVPEHENRKLYCFLSIKTDRGDL